MFVMLMVIGCMNDNGDVAPVAPLQDDALSTPQATMGAGLYNACALDDGDIECWGNNSTGQVDAPRGPFIGLEVNFWSTCGLTEHGDAICWGDSQYQDERALDVPSGPWLKVTFGGNHGCGIRDDHSLGCWGSDYYGQTDAPGGHDWIDVASTTMYSCGVRSSGALDCWGDLDAATSASADGHAMMDQPDGSFIRVTAGLFANMCAERVDGTWVCWGVDDSGEASGVPSDGTFLDVQMGDGFGCGLGAENALTCWGSDVYGETDIPPRDGWLRIGVGWKHMCAEDVDGRVLCWGRNIEHQLD